MRSPIYAPSLRRRSQPTNGCYKVRITSAYWKKRAQRLQDVSTRVLIFVLKADTAVSSKEEPVRGAGKAKMIAQSRPLIVLAEQTAPLQFWNQLLRDVIQPLRQEGEDAGEAI